MKEQYKTFILEQINEALASSAEDKTRVLLRDALLAKHLPRERAERAASIIDISVDDEMFSDTVFMTKVVDAFSELIVQKSLFADTAFQDSYQAFVDLIEGFSLRLIAPQ